MVIKSIIAALIAGMLYTIFIALFVKKKGGNPSNTYLSGIFFTVVIFILFLVLYVF